MKLYVIDEAQLTIIRRAADRLFTEERMHGDTMRDMAQALRLIHDVCQQMEIPLPKSPAPEDG